MADCPDYFTIISLILSRMMNDVGVNEECVIKRRRTNLMAENILTFTQIVCNKTAPHYIFGSQTEGTTTVDLNSDIDLLGLSEDIKVIQDWKDWKCGERNLLMLRDERLYPGYCKLQVLYKDVPLPVSEDHCPRGGLFCIDSDGHVLLKDNGADQIYTGFDRHGPAATSTYGNVEYDNVPALRCNTWPLHYKQWTPTNKKRDWPTPQMIQHMKSTGCFVVKAAHRLDERNETWRISTSLAERCLMFSLNITQIRCYVLLKMIVKTFIKPHLPDTISSYMCKTLMFHCIENTRQELWTEHNLLRCVHLALLYMIAAVLDENCPNYFNESANLFLGKINMDNKKKLVSILRGMLISRGRFILFISLDSINRRLTTYISDFNYVVPQAEVKILQLYQCEQCLYVFLPNVSTFQRVKRHKYSVGMRDGLFAKVGNFAAKEKSGMYMSTFFVFFPGNCRRVQLTESELSDQTVNIEAV